MLLFQMDIQWPRTKGRKKKKRGKIEPVTSMSTSFGIKQTWVQILFPKLKTYMWVNLLKLQILSLFTWEDLHLIHGKAKIIR